MQKIAKDVLTIPISIVALESAFGTGSRMLSPHHSSPSWVYFGGTYVCTKLVET